MLLPTILYKYEKKKKQKKTLRRLREKMGKVMDNKFVGYLMKKREQLTSFKIDNHNSFIY